MRRQSRSGAILTESYDLRAVIRRNGTLRTFVGLTPRLELSVVAHISSLLPKPDQAVAQAIFLFVGGDFATRA